MNGPSVVRTAARPHAWPPGGDRAVRWFCGLIICFFLDVGT
jgi:hypothetical protein